MYHRQSQSLIAYQGAPGTKILLCTPQLAASDLIKKYFAASRTEGIVIIADEDGQCLEMDNS